MKNEPPTTIKGSVDIKMVVNIVKHVTTLSVAILAAMATLFGKLAPLPSPVDAAFFGLLLEVSIGSLALSVSGAISFFWFLPKAMPVFRGLPGQHKGDEEAINFIWLGRSFRWCLVWFLVALVSLAGYSGGIVSAMSSGSGG